jgi:tetratricopeptide (TPR) repeat protein
MKNDYTWIAYCDLLLSMGDMERTEKAYMDAMYHCGQSDNLMTRFTVFLHENGDSKRALKLLTENLKLHNTAKAHFQLGWYYEKSNVELASLYYSKSIELMPDSIDNIGCYENYAHVLCDSYDDEASWKLAKDLCERALKYYPNRWYLYSTYREVCRKLCVQGPEKYLLEYMTLYPEDQTLRTEWIAYLIGTPQDYDRALEACVDWKDKNKSINVMFSISFIIR